MFRRRFRWTITRRLFLFQLFTAPELGRPSVPIFQRHFQFKMFVDENADKHPVRNCPETDSLNRHVVETSRQLCAIKCATPAGMCGGTYLL